MDTLVLNDCSIRDDWDHIRTFDRRKPLSETVRHLQLIMLQIIPSQMVTFLNLFKGLQVLEMDVCDLDLDSISTKVVCNILGAVVGRYNDTLAGDVEVQLLDLVS